MPDEDDFFDRSSQPRKDTVVRGGDRRETVPLSRERPLDPPPWQVGENVGDFVILGVLGSGVTSTVYKVRNRATGKTAALKVLRTRCEETLAASRLGYRRVMPLRHPSLVRIDGMYHLEDRVAFTMEEVTGQSISRASRCIRGDRQKIFKLAAHVINDVGGALQTLHGAGLVHRDVKPENLLVEASGAVRLIDYGLVGCFDPESDPDARRSYLAGTFWYMAPESISSQIYPPACDVYALGCVVLELIADPTRLPDPEEGKSLVDAVEELDSVIPLDTPDELRDLLHEMLDAKIENRPLASQLVRYGRAQLTPGGDAGLLVRPTDLIGRESEMQQAAAWFHNVARGGTGWLHLCGESGTGKTWFAGELRRQLSGNPWFQVFASACLPREDVSFQAFDEMVDAVARRYIRDDRDPIRLPTSAVQILSQSFPVLRPILRPQDSDYSAGGSPAGRGDQASAGGEAIRSDALGAAVQFVARLCDYGPVLLVIDDLQWADRDSIHVLDHLLDEVQGKCGIVTVARDSETPLRHQPDELIRLHPLDVDQSRRLLQNLLGSDFSRLDETTLGEVCRLCRGNAFRLTHLAADLSVNRDHDWQQRLREGTLGVDDLWESKLDLLSRSAETYLRFLVTAGGPVSVELLGAATERAEEADLMVWELIRYRLARESGAGDEIEVAHSRIAAQVLASLDDSEKAELHLRWANHLKQSGETAADPSQSFAPRIAWHLLEAGRTADAAPFAVCAARDALSRFAYVEAAKWFTRAADLDTDQSAGHLRSALVCYETAGYPAEAADTCRRLLNHPSLDPESEEASDLQRRFAEHLFRCGRLVEARAAVEKLAERFGLPRRKPAWLSVPALALSMLRLSLSRKWQVMRDGDSRIESSADDTPRAPADAPADNFNDRYIRAAMSLARPMSLYENNYALELILAGVRALSRSSRPSLRITAQVPFAVIGAYNPGRSRDRGWKLLEDAQRKAEALGDATAIADVHAGWGHRHWITGHWDRCAGECEAAIEMYIGMGERNSFEINHMRVPLLWSLCKLGRFAELSVLAQQMARQAEERADHFAYQATHAGLAGVSRLVADDPESMRVCSNRCLGFLRGAEAPIAQLMVGVGAMLRWLYVDRPQSTLRFIDAAATGKRRQILRRIQLIRVLYAEGGALAALRSAHLNPSRMEAHYRSAETHCRWLAREATPYSLLTANYLSAYVALGRGHRGEALRRFSEAAEEAGLQKLSMIEQAALDSIDRIEGRHAERLQQHLIAEGVANPQRFELLYRPDVRLQQ